MSLENKQGWIWMDWECVPWAEAKAHCLTHTLHYGVGAFEGIRAYATSEGPAIFRLDEHTDRLFDSAHILHMPMPYDKATLKQVQRDIVLKNQLNAAYIRPLVYYGAESLGLHAKKLEVHVMIATWSWGAYLGAENLTKGIRVRTSSYTRHSVNSVMTRAKACGNYLNSILALREA